MQSHACTRYVSNLPLSLSLSFSDLSCSLPLVESTPLPPPPPPPLPPSFLTCRECVSAIAACTDADTLPRAEAHKEVFNIDELVPLAAPATRRVSTLRLSLSLLRASDAPVNLYSDTRGTRYSRVAHCDTIPFARLTVSAIQPRSASSFSSSCSTSVAFSSSCRCTYF